MKFLTLEEIKEKAPAVLSTAPAENLSEKYVHVPTLDLIQDMEKLGWKVSNVQQVNSKRNKQAFKKHLVTFRNEEVVIQSEDGEVAYPQILLSNSHDGTSSFQFRAGIFRLVCSNGLVVSTHDFGAMSIRHKGYSFEELKKTVLELVEKLPVTIETLNRFREVILTEEQKVEFALAAIGIRFGETGAEVQVQELLKPVRKEDEGDELWQIFNIIQEKLTKGGFRYKASTGRNKTARSIKNFNRDIELNESLYQLAESFI